MRKVRILAAIGLIAGLLFGLGGCVKPLIQPRAALIIGAPVVSGDRATVAISVSHMPQGGLASIAVELGGMIYDPAKIRDVTIVGKSGFRVLASEFDDTTGRGRFVLASIGGCEGGTVAELRFRTLGPVGAGDLVFDRGKIELGSAADHLITDWDLRTDVGYYAR